MREPILRGRDSKPIYGPEKQDPPFVPPMKDPSPMHSPVMAPDRPLNPTIPADHPVILTCNDVEIKRIKGYQANYFRNLLEMFGSGALGMKIGDEPISFEIIKESADAIDVVLGYIEILKKVPLPVDVSEGDPYHLPEEHTTYFRMPFGEVFKLISVGQYLGFDECTRCCARVCAIMLKGKLPNEIRTIFGMPPIVFKKIGDKKTT